MSPRSTWMTLLLLRPSLIAIFDRLKDSITLVTQIRPQDWDNAETAWEHAHTLLSKAINSLDNPLPHTEVGDATAPCPNQPQI